MSDVSGESSKSFRFAPNRQPMLRPHLRSWLRGATFAGADAALDPIPRKVVRTDVASLMDFIRAWIPSFGKQQESPMPESAPWPGSLTGRERRETAAKLAECLEDIAKKSGLILPNKRTRETGDQEAGRLGPWISWRQNPNQNKPSIRILPDGSHPSCKSCPVREVYQVSFLMRSVGRAQGWDLRFEEKGVQIGTGDMEERTRPLICHRCKIPEELSRLLVEAIEEALGTAS